VTVAWLIADDSDALVTLGRGTLHIELASDLHDPLVLISSPSNAVLVIDSHHVFDDLRNVHVHHSTPRPIFKCGRVAPLRNDFANSFTNASRSSRVASRCKRLVSFTVIHRPAMCIRGRFTHRPTDAT
jgi:hypothetical protein